MLRQVATWTSLLVISTLVAGIPNAHAACGPSGEPSARARAANDRAIELGKQNDYPSALREFQIAYDDCPSYVILYNIAKMARLTRDFSRSLEAYQRYLDDGRGEVDAARRSEVEREIADLSTLVGYVTVEAPTGATVKIDGVVVGDAMLRKKLAVNPGAHTFEAVLDGKTARENASIRAGDSTKVILSFQTKAAEVPPDDDEQGGYTFPTGWVVVSWITTGVVGAGAVVSGSLALGASHDLADDTYIGPERSPPQDSEISAKADRVDAMAKISNVLWIATAAVGGTAIALTIVDAVGDSDSPATPPPKRVQLQLGPGSISIHGRFE